MPQRTQSVAAAIAQYVTEREAKRAHGIADVLPHAAFDGRPGEFTFVGRRTIDGHNMLLVRDSKKIVVLPAREQAEALKIGDRISLDRDGAIVQRSQGRRR